MFRYGNKVRSEASRRMLAGERVLVDSDSGKLARRPELARDLLGRMGYRLVVAKRDRLGLSLAHMIALSLDLQARGLAVVVIDQGIDTGTPMGRMFFQILGSHPQLTIRPLPMPGAARARRYGMAGWWRREQASHGVLCRSLRRPCESCPTPVQDCSGQSMNGSCRGQHHHLRLSRRLRLAAARSLLCGSGDQGRVSRARSRSRRLTMRSTMTSGGSER